MIYRMTVVTSKRDFVRSAVDKFFQDYLIIQADSYKDNVKRMALVIEIEGKKDGSDLEQSYRAANQIAKEVGVSVNLQLCKNETLQATIESPIVFCEPSKQKTTAIKKETV